MNNILDTLAEKLESQAKSDNGIKGLQKDDIDEINATISELDAVSTAFNIDFYISASIDVESLVPALREKVVAAL